MLQQRDRPVADKEEDDDRHPDEHGCECDEEDDEHPLADVAVTGGRDRGGGEGC